MRRLVAALILLTPVLALARQVPYAIVIGNNAPPAGEALTPLRYSDDDAVRFAQLFSQMGAEVRLLSVLDADTQRRYPGTAGRTRPPTLANLSQAVSELAERMTRDRARHDDPVLYFVFSGHGVWNERGPPMLSMLDGGLTQAFLYEQILAQLPATYAHLIVDACHAGAVVGVRGGETFRQELDARVEPLPAADARALLDGASLRRFPQVGVLIATSPDQEAHEWSRFESGVFSHELLSGLLGGADANGDEQIEYSEAQAFVAAANRQVGDPRAVPRVIAVPPRSNLNVSLVSLRALRGATVLHGELSGLGAFHVELDDGQRLLDAHFAPDSLASIAIPAGAHVFVVRAETEAELIARGGDLDVRLLRFRRRREQPRGSVDADYRAGLFAAPYGAAYYRGFVDSSGGSAVRFDPSVRVEHHDALRLRTPAYALLGLGAAATAGSIAAGVLMLQARREFDGTGQQVAAHAAEDRYDRALGASIATGVVAVGTGVAGLVLWLRSRQ
jgi:hypothetical protein